ncbi:MAG: diguanylate cyclase, partial [Cycloclasticus sp.]|nr:diguanylate cyclase [Cycloclasticus sp.]
MSREKKVFFSIKWKALLLFGLLISVSHAIQYGISYQQINDQFQRQHNQELHYQHSIIEALIEQSARLMEQITELSDTPYNDNPSHTEDYIASSLEQQWDSLQANWGLTAILMYNNKGQAKKSWGSDSRKLIQQNDLASALQTAKPMHRLICADQCYQIVYIPTLVNPNSEQHALIVFVRSLADIIISFKETTRTDIAILRPALNTKNAPGKQLNIAASTNTKQLKKLLKNVSLSHSIDALLSNETTLQFLGGKQFSLRLFNLGEPGQPNSPYLLLATDLTNEYILINQSKKEALYAILLALIASSLILLPFLLKVTQRIITVSNALPALSKGHYYQAKQYLQKADKQSQKIQDEFDTLEKSTLLVIEQLEKGSQLIKEKEQNLVWLADHDSLTQLFNRRRFQVEFEHQLKLAERYKNSGAILYLDLDQFKYINDTSGHAAGDLLLKQVAETLQQVIRSSDTLAR